MNHLMIDIETLGTRPDAAIVQIGAVVFSKEAGVTEKFKVNVSPDDAFKLGASIDWSTISWWMKQSDAARLSIATGRTRSELGAISELAAFVSGFELETVWAHGACLDFPVLESAFHRQGVDVPWRFWEVRDCRTLEQFAPDAVRPNPAIAHDALSDAEAQALWVINMAKALG